MDIRTITNSLERILIYLNETQADEKTKEAFNHLRNEITKGILFIMELTEEKGE